MMLKHDQTLSDLRSVSASTGKLTWIGLRPAHHQAMIMPKTATLLENNGIAGDHIAKYSSMKRQISLIQAEHLAVIAKLMNTNTISAETFRRNLVVEGINLLSLKDQRFSIGDCTPLKGVPRSSKAQANVIHVHVWKMPSAQGVTMPCGGMVELLQK